MILGLKCFWYLKLNWRFVYYTTTVKLRLNHALDDMFALFTDFFQNNLHDCLVNTFNRFVSIDQMCIW